MRIPEPQTQVIEIALDPFYISLWRRVFHSIRTWFVTYVIAVLICFIANFALLIPAIICGTLFLINIIYSLYANWKILYKVSYYPESHKIEIFAVRKSTIQLVISASITEVEIHLSEDHAGRYTESAIFFYDRHKMIFNQRADRAGWTRERLNEIVSLSKHSSIPDRDMH